MKIEYELAAVLSAIVKTFACKLTRIQCSYAGGADGWVQFFDAKALPANGANPKFELKMFAGSVRFDEFTDLSFSTGCVIAVSTTAAVLTIASAGAELTGLIEGETPTNDTGWLTAGGYVTGDDDLQVWNDAGGPKRLIRLEFTQINATPAVQYPMLFSLDSPQSTDKPVWWETLPAGGSIGDRTDFWFGVGLFPYRKTSAGVESDAGQVRISTSPTLFTLSVTADYAIKATYMAA